LEPTTAEVVVGELRNHATRRSGSRVFRTSLEARLEVEKKTALVILPSGCQFCQTTVNQSHTSLCCNGCMSAVGTRTFDHTSQVWWHSQVGSALPSYAWCSTFRS